VLEPWDKAATGHDLAQELSLKTADFIKWQKFEVLWPTSSRSSRLALLVHFCQLPAQ
jgi:hypothetical protein